MGRGPTPGVELLADLRSARALARSWSLEALRGVVTDPPDLELRPHLLQAFVGLRNPRSRVASALEQLGEHLVCGRCAGRVFVDVDPVGEQGWLRVCRSADGRREEDLVEVHDVASELDERAARGRRWLGGEGDPDWPLEATLDVLAAVATEVGWGRASGALVVAAAARCPTCGAALDLAATLDLAPYTLA